ncbi:MAG: hypothetical protein ABI611_13680 [Solirubrobacteraceae bacterium]
MTSLRWLLTTALLALALSATASAKTVTYKNIVGPNQQVSCFAVKGSTEIECSAPFVPEIGELDTYLAVRARGKAKLSERGDYPGYDAPRRTLHFGDIWQRPGVRCKLRSNGLTCRNLDDHGFHLQPHHVRRF